MGIKVSELRIGNKLISQTHNILNATVSGIMPNGIIMLKEVTTYDVSDKVNPIPITPEILESIGFVNYPEYDEPEFWEYKKLALPDSDTDQIVFKDNKIIVSGRYSPDFYGVSTKVLYVHELQNLYFALTQTELNIKL